MCVFRNRIFLMETGYGGGYNDRGVVEYKERAKESDDDEYDEFGRRKKKRDESRRSVLPRYKIRFLFLVFKVK